MTLFNGNRRALVREAIKRGDAGLLKTPDALAFPPARPRPIRQEPIVDPDAPTWQARPRVVFAGLLPMGPPPQAPAQKASNPVADMDLMLASMNGNLNGIKAAIAAGADANCRDANGVTPLMHSAQNGTPAVILELIRSGARVHERDNEGKIAPMYSAIYGRQDAVETFIRINSFNLEQRDNSGKTILIHAAKSGYRRIIEKLLDAGAQIDAKDQNGRTALMLAAKYGNIPEASALLMRHADVNARSNSGKTALQYAIDYGHSKMVPFLKQYGAR